MYLLTLPNGGCIVFHLLGCAEIYQQCYGGTIVHSDSAKIAA